MADSTSDPTGDPGGVPSGRPRVELSIAGLLRVLANTTRLQILSILVGSPRTARQVAASMGLPVPAVFQHLLRLYQYGLVTVVGRRDGHYFRLSPLLRASAFGSRVRLELVSREGEELVLVLQK